MCRVSKGTTPETPSRRFARKVLRSLPFGAVRPTPVMTTRARLCGRCMVGPPTTMHRTRGAILGAIGDSAVGSGRFFEVFAQQVSAEVSGVNAAKQCERREVKARRRGNSALAGGAFGQIVPSRERMP